MDKDIEDMFDEDGMLKVGENSDRYQNKKQLEEDVESLEEKLDVEIELKFRESMSTAKCSQESENGNEKHIIHYGTDNKLLQNLKVARKILAHEALHAGGKRHNKSSRNEGYYSDPSKDTFTKELMEEMGWEPPTREEVRACWL